MGEIERNEDPLESPKMEVRGYVLAIQFHPSVKLEPRKGYDFAAKLSAYVNPKTVVLDANEWKFSDPLDGSPRSKLGIVISQNRLQMDATLPPHAQEWFEHRFLAILELFRREFKPEIILVSGAMVRAIQPLGVDARQFLARRIGHFEKSCQVFGRPIHLVGFRFFFPPVVGPETRLEWQVDVKVESLAENPQVLFFEADARWPKPVPWTEEAEKEIVQHLATAKDYVQTNVVGFLRQQSQGETEEAPE